MLLDVSYFSHIFLWDDDLVAMAIALGEGAKSTMDWMFSKVGSLPVYPPPDKRFQLKITPFSIHIQIYYCFYIHDTLMKHPWLGCFSGQPRQDVLDTMDGGDKVEKVAISWLHIETPRLEASEIDHGGTMSCWGLWKLCF